MLEEYKEGDVVTLNQNPYHDGDYEHERKYVLGVKHDDAFVKSTDISEHGLKIIILNHWIKEKVEK